MDFALPQEPPAYRLAGTPLEEDVVGNDDGTATIHIEQGKDVLEEVELLVFRGGPEVLSLVGDVLLLKPPSSVTKETLLFLPKGGLVRTILKRLPGSWARESTPEETGEGSESMPCR